MTAYRLLGRFLLFAVAAGLLHGGARAAGNGNGNACSKPITMSTGEWAPYNYFDDQQKRHRGLDIELVQAIFDEAGCQLVLAPPRPASRNTMMFEQAQLDMMSGASKSPERQAIAWFSTRYRHEVVSLFVLADRSGKYKDIASFDALMRARLTVLAPRTGYYGAAYAAHMPALQAAGRLYQFAAVDQGVVMLAAGRADTLLGDVESVVLGAVRKNVRVIALPVAVADASVHLMFNKATVPEADVRRIDVAIARLEKRGILERIRKAYLVY